VNQVFAALAFGVIGISVLLSGIGSFWLAMSIRRESKESQHLPHLQTFDTFAFGAFFLVGFMLTGVGICMIGSLIGGGA
jgi:hypothetical protein